MNTDKLDIPIEIPAARLPAEERRVVDTTDLFRGESEIFIRHAGALYRMKITRQGKLILNK